MRFLLAVLVLASLASGDKHFNRKLLHYLILSQFQIPSRNAPRKLIVLPILLPIPIGITKKLFLHRHNNLLTDNSLLLTQRAHHKAEVLIHATPGECGQPFCGGATIFI